MIESPEKVETSTPVAEVCMKVPIGCDPEGRDRLHLLEEHFYYTEGCRSWSIGLSC